MIGLREHCLDLRQGAATSDPEAAKLCDEMVQQRRHAIQGAAQLFADVGALRPDIDVGVAADLMWFYNDPSLYEKLVRQRGWPVSRFRAWLAEALQVQLPGISSKTESPSAKLPGQKS